MQSLLKLALIGLAVQPSLVLSLPDIFKRLHGPVALLADLLGLVWTEMIQLVYAWASS